MQQSQTDRGGTPARTALGRWVESAPVQSAIIGLIVLNTIILGLETSPGVMARAGTVLTAVDALILAVFVVEIALKLLAQGARYLPIWVARLRFPGGRHSTRTGQRALGDPAGAADPSGGFNTGSDGDTTGDSP